MAITMSRPQYDALVAAGLEANTTELLRIRKLVDASNGITRYKLLVRWQDIGGQTPPRIELGLGWPPEMTYTLELERRITRSDVDEILASHATDPVSTMVTPDPNGEVGWTLIEDYLFT